MEILGVIPARYSSSRLPGKPLKLIDDIPMIVRVYRQACKSQYLDNVIVATDDILIQECCEENSIPCLMTRSDHESGSDRVAEAVELYEELYSKDISIVVNIQGDMPFICPHLIDVVIIRKMLLPQRPMVSVCTKNYEKACLKNPDIVKCKVNQEGEAYEFNRISYGHQDMFCVSIGIYAFSRVPLSLFVDLKPGPLEQSLKIEHLRYIERGVNIPVIVTDDLEFSVDTLDELKEANNIARRLRSEC